jgi:hypothetical protein
MNRSPLIFLALIAACSAGAESNEAAGSEANPTNVTVEAPPGGQAQGFETILGAIDGPCGAPKAEEFLGRKWTDDSAAAMQAKTGSSEVKPFKFNDIYDPSTKMDERRLNVYLSPSGRIVHLVCG